MPQGVPPSRQKGVPYPRRAVPPGNSFFSSCGNYDVGLDTHQARVSTVAGYKGREGYADGWVRAGAKFRLPMGLSFLRDGSLVVADAANNRIRRIEFRPSRHRDFIRPGYPDVFNGYVTTLAGSGDTRNFFGDSIPQDVPLKDGHASVATFQWPTSVAVDRNDNIYVADCHHHAIRLITPSGQVTTIAGNGTFGYRDGHGTSASFAQPSSLVLIPGDPRHVDTLGDSRDDDGVSEKYPMGNPGDPRLMIADSVNARIGMLNLRTGRVRTLNGTGLRGSLMIPLPHSLAYDGTGAVAEHEGSLFIGAHTIPYIVREVSSDAKFYRTIAGPPIGRVGFRRKVVWQTPEDRNGRTRSGEEGGVVEEDDRENDDAATTNGKSINPHSREAANYHEIEDGQVADKDGFSAPYALAVDPTNKLLYVADTMHNRIVAVSRDLRRFGNQSRDPADARDSPASPLPSGTGWDSATNREGREPNPLRVEVLAGNGGLCASFDGYGTSARFAYPQGLAVAVDGSLYIADTVTHCIRRLDYVER